MRITNEFFIKNIQEIEITFSGESISWINQNEMNSFCLKSKGNENEEGEINARWST